MKNNNKNQTRQTPAQKITEAACGAFFLTALGLSLFLPESYRYYTALCHGFFTAGVLLLLVNMGITPNTDTYRCNECGHTYIPEGSGLMGGKVRRDCPACHSRTLHAYVVPENFMFKKEN